MVGAAAAAANKQPPLILCALPSLAGPATALAAAPAAPAQSSSRLFSQPPKAPRSSRPGRFLGCSTTRVTTSWVGGEGRRGGAGEAPGCGASSSAVTLVGGPSPSGGAGAGGAAAVPLLPLTWLGAMPVMLAAAVALVTARSRAPTPVLLLLAPLGSGGALPRTAAAAGWGLAAAPPPPPLVRWAGAAGVAPLAPAGCLFASCAATGRCCEGLGAGAPAAAGRAGGSAAAAAAAMCTLSSTAQAASASGAHGVMLLLGGQKRVQACHSVSEQHNMSTRPPPLPPPQGRAASDRPKGARRARADVRG
jgi:hypothetical protein